MTGEKDREGKREPWRQVLSEGGPGEEPRTKLLVEAMSHPLRTNVLYSAAEGRRTFTIKELAEMLHQPPRRIRHHVDALREQGLIRMVGERTVRGVRERSFELTVVPALPRASHSQIDPEQQRQIASHVLTTTVREAAAALRAETFGRGDGAELIFRQPVDQKGWEELQAIHDEVLERVQRVVTESKARLDAGDEPPVPAVSVHLLFEGAGQPSHASAPSRP